MDKDTKIKEKNESKSTLFDWGEALVFSLSVLIIVLVFFVRMIGVDGSSMYPTLQDGNRILISNIMYQPQKEDIVVLTKSSFLPEPIVKRVIATQGDTIDVNYEAGEVIVNGKVQNEGYINEKVSLKNVGDMQFPQTVPKGCIFVMGDNRNHSTDSRFLSLGMVDTRYVQGKVIASLFPISEFGKVN